MGESDFDTIEANEKNYIYILEDLMRDSLTSEKLKRSLLILRSLGKYDEKYSLSSSK